MTQFAMVPPAEGWGYKPTEEQVKHFVSERRLFWRTEVMLNDVLRTSRLLQLSHPREPKTSKKRPPRTALPRWGGHLGTFGPPPRTRGRRKGTQSARCRLWAGMILKPWRLQEPSVERSEPASGGNSSAGLAICAERVTLTVQQMQFGTNCS
jgi:hypothetical protein